MSTDFWLSLRVVVGITCLTSIFGASVIILTYAAFRDLRTLARQLLVNLSVADIMVASSHFVGLVAVRVENYSGLTDDYNISNVSNTSSLPTTDTLCVIQAAFTMCGTISSFLWTLALGLYMMMVIVLRRPDFARYSVFVYYPVCWGVSVALALWFALVKPTYLGFASSADVAWCYIRLVPHSDGEIDRPATILAQLLGYELWVYITFVALLVLYLTMLCYLKYRWPLYRNQTKRTTDLKLIFVPLIFFLLRVWSAAIDVPIYFLSTSKSEEFRMKTVALVMISGIGDSAQGLANSILFCLFTKQVRQKLLRLLCCCSCCCHDSCNRLSEMWPFRLLSSSKAHVSVHETTTQLDSDSLSIHSRLVHREQTIESSLDMNDNNDDRTVLLRESHDGTVVRNYGTKIQESS